MQYSNTVIVPLIMGIVQVLKPYIKDNRYIPVIALLLGLLFGALTGDGNVVEKIIQGLTMGLASSGLYEITLDR